MKYCPYCGAVLSDNTVSFCLQCKKEVTGVKEPVEKKKTRKNKKRAPEIKKEVIGVGYGDYYADVKPEDADIRKRKKASSGKKRYGKPYRFIRTISIVPREGFGSCVEQHKNYNYISSNEWLKVCIFKIS